jgi:hypothetical protein
MARRVIDILVRHWISRGIRDLYEGRRDGMYGSWCG